MHALQHRSIAAGQIHSPYNWIVADAAGMAALVVTADDLYKVAYRLDIGASFVLVATDPVTWVQDGAAWLNALISESVTINVPADYATIDAAWAARIQGKRIAADASVTIKVADGTQTLTVGLVLNHPDGERIRLVGNEANPDACIITVAGAPTFDALVVSDGYTLGYLNGFKFDLAAKATSANGYTAVLAMNGGKIICGPKIKTNNWYYGIAQRGGSFIYARYAQVENAGDVGIWSFNSGHIDARNAISNNASDTVNGFGWGFEAEYGGTIDCQGASATGCNVAGFGALSRGVLRALSAVSSGNVGSGFYALDGGHIEHHGAVAQNNARYGEEFYSGGTIVGNGTTVDGTNTLGARSGKAYLANSPSLGARLAADGTLRIDNNGVDSIFFNTSGGAQAEVAHTASSSSYPTLSGSSSNTPRVGASGAASNIDLYLQSKGTGSVFLGNQLTNFLRVNPSASGTPRLAAEGGTNVDIGVRAKGTGSVFLGENQVNYVRINSGASGTSPQVRAEGETNLDLILGGKGTGLVRFGVTSATADVPCSKLLQMKDFAGNTINVLVQ